MRDRDFDHGNVRCYDLDDDGGDSGSWYLSDDNSIDSTNVPDGGNLTYENIILEKGALGRSLRKANLIHWRCSSTTFSHASVPSKLIKHHPNGSLTLFIRKDTVVTISGLLLFIVHKPSYFFKCMVQ